nr:SOS response-associated peptidase family protein [Edaphobacter aggregans]
MAATAANPTSSASPTPSRQLPVSTSSTSVPDDDIAPGSVQPVVSVNQDGERQLELMRWGFKLPDRLLFNARSEGIETSKFWKDAFLKGRVIVPADSIFEWKEVPKGQKKPNYEFTLTGRSPLAWRVSGNSGRTRRPISGSAHSPLSLESRMN